MGFWKDPNSSFAQFTPKKMPKVVKGPVAGPQKISDGAAVCPLEHCIGETRGLDAHPPPQERPRLEARRAKHPRQRAGAGGQKSSARGRQPRTFGSRVKDGTGRAPPRVVERRGRPAEELAAGDEEPEKRRLDDNPHQEEQERPRLEVRRAKHPKHLVPARTAPALADGQLAPRRHAPREDCCCSSPWQCLGVRLPLGRVRRAPQEVASARSGLKGCAARVSCNVPLDDQALDQAGGGQGPRCIVRFRWRCRRQREQFRQAERSPL